jgi:magnesium-protoporphyrin O-methyltransferase
MAGCCEPRAYQRLFSAKQARRDSRRYRKRDVGGGVGSIELELLAAGAERATNVELSGEYEDEAAKLLAELGLADRVERRVADFVTEPVEPHDVVVMHRVVCCYPDVDGLVGAGAANARRRLLLTYPQERLWVRLAIRVINLFLRLSGSSFRTYVHPVARMSAAAGAHGLVLGERRRHGPMWESAAFVRA